MNREQYEPDFSKSRIPIIDDAKLSFDDLAMIHKLSERYSRAELAALFKVSKSTIDSALGGKEVV